MTKFQNFYHILEFHLIETQSAAIESADQPVGLLGEHEGRLDRRRSCRAARPHFYARSQRQAERGNLTIVEVDASFYQNVGREPFLCRV